MARPLKVGIDYFPTDVDIDQDDKILMVKNKFGLVGMGTVMMLLARIYKTGYYYDWTEREQELFAGHFREEVNVINNVVNECIKWGFFDKNKLSEHNILTSKGIQKRYLLAVERRKDKGIIDDYWLIEKGVNDNTNGVNVNNNSINVNNKSVNASKSTQSKVNRKESINNTTTRESHIQIINLYCSLHNKLDINLKPKERSEILELVESEIPLDFITENMQKIFERSGEQVRGFGYYSTIIKDAWTNSTTPSISKKTKNNTKKYDDLLGGFLNE